MPACAEQTPGNNVTIAAMLGALVAVPFYSRRTVLLTPRLDEPPAQPHRSRRAGEVGQRDRRDHLGFQPTGQPTPLSPAVLSLQGTPTAAGSMSAGVRPPGGAATWRMYDFRNVERAQLAGRLQDPGTPAVSFLVENVPALLARLKAAGVTVDSEGGEAVNVDGRLRAFIRDPNGLLIELVEAGVI